MTQYYRFMGTVEKRAGRTERVPGPPQDEKTQVGEMTALIAPDVVKVKVRKGLHYTV